VVLLAAFMAMALAGLLAFVVVNGKGSDTHAAPPPRHARHHYPKHWNHKIAPYAKIASKERGLKFKHPVPVRFLSAKAFAKSLRAEDGKVTKKDRRQLTQVTGLFRALGLLNGKVDLLKASRQASGAGTLAYYSFKDKRVTIRGRTITPSMRSTLVHELTHALQDQHFHVGARLKKLEKAEYKSQDGSAADVLDAIVEGDARRVEALYAASLNTAQRRALARAQNAEYRGAKPGLARVPKIIVAEDEAPYDLGLALTSAVALHGGNGAVNRLLRKPPTHDSVLLDPTRELNGTTGAATVTRPALGRGDKKFDSGEFGALSWYFVLAARIPTTQALAAADGWGGDAYVAYQHGGTTCARLRFAGRTADDTSRMYSALRQWVGAGPSGTSSVRMVGARVQMQSCDPGTAVRSGTGSATAALSLAATRNELTNGIMRSGGTPVLAHCYADRLVQTFSVTQLDNPAFGSDDPTLQQEFQELAASCT
jgi:hypothetical protein